MKKLWLVFPALLLIAGLVFMGCPGDPSGNEEEEGDITWELSQDGEEDEDGLGTKTTTAITIKFSSDVTGLRGQDVTLSTGNVTQGALTGSGKEWKVAVTVANPGNVSVDINKEGIEKGPQTIRVIKEGTYAPITYTAVADGVAGTTTSTKITFTFDKDVTGLTADAITITPAGSVVKGALTGSAKVWTLALASVNQEGDVTVKITKEGIDAGDTTVAVYMKPIEEYQFYFDAESKMYFYIEDYMEETLVGGETYTIKLDIKQFDSRLSGCHFGGQIFVDTDDDYDEDTDGWSNELAGWGNGNPDTVSASPRAYTWLLTIVDPIPDEATGKAFFQLMAQVPAWGSGIENAETVGFNADFTIELLVPLDLVLNEDITITDGLVANGGDYSWSGGASTPYKGKLTATKSAEIKAVDGVLRIYITGTISSAFQGGWGIGRVGPDANEGENAYPISVPGNAPKLENNPDAAGDEYSFSVDIPIDEIVLDGGEISINYWSADTVIDKIEVWVLAE